MGRSRSQRRAVAGLMIDLFDENTSLGWRVKYRVSAELALEKIALKQWREIWLTNGELAGVQALRPEQKKTLNQVLVAELLATTITLNELLRNAQCYGRSRTMGMPEWKRLQRHVWRRGQSVANGKPVYYKSDEIAPPEDATERAIAKVRLWPHPASRAMDAKGEPVSDKNGAPVFGDKAVRVYPPTQQSC